MKHFRKLRFAALLLGAIVSLSTHAQENDDNPAPAKPNLVSMEANWWSYLEGSQDEVEIRVTDFLTDISTEVTGLQLANEEIGQAVLDAVRDNLAAYLALLDEDTLQLQDLPQPKISYSLDDLLRLAGVSRDAIEGARREQLEVDREQRILEGTARRRDQAFKDYVDSPSGDERIVAALRLVQSRSAQAIATRRLSRLTQSLDRATAYANSTADRVVLASDRLATTEDEAGLDVLVEQVVLSESAAAEAREQLRTAELEASGLDLDTPQGRSQQRLLQQKLIDAEVAVAQADIQLAQAQARRAWTELKLGNAPDMGDLADLTLAWSELSRSVGQSTSSWQSDSENELLAVQTMDRDGLDRASRRLLDQRLGTAQSTLSHISEVEDDAADLELLGGAVDNAVAEYSGVLSSWFREAGRSIQSAYIRVTGLADVTLFSVGETPVTGRDILRVFIILLIAFLLSRGIRYAIKRVGKRESSGAQASLYTLSRLTHYTIIIIAIFIALSSIGLDFSNLALVAGALSVGIGFGLQSMVSNFVSGLIILFEHTLRVGDYIELDTGLTGTVKAINVRSTLINTNDNIDIVVPNSEFVTARLTNWTLGERVLRVRIPFGVAYGSDKEVVREAAIEAANEVSYTLTHMKNRTPDVWLVDFGDSSLDFLLTVWVNRDGARRPTRTRAAYLWALETKLNEKGIEIPFPQRDLNLRSRGGVLSVALEAHDPTAADMKQVADPEDE